MNTRDDNGWDENKRYIRFELKRQREELKRQRECDEKIIEKLDNFKDETYKKLDKIGNDIATLKVKAGTWGAIAGFVSAIGILIWILVEGVL